MNHYDHEYFDRVSNPPTIYTISKRRTGEIEKLPISISLILHLQRNHPIMTRPNLINQDQPPRPITHSIQQTHKLSYIHLMPIR